MSKTWAGGCFTLSILVILVSCATGPSARGPQHHVANPEARLEKPGLQNKLVEAAVALLGAEELVIQGKRFNLDCTGVVLAIYAYAGIDLSHDFNLYQGNGVRRLYSSLESKGLLYHTFNPAPGDIIFWDNTWDRDGDGKWNDSLTHTGMVVRVSHLGAIEYVHHNYRRGIVMQEMNLNDPDTFQKTEKGVIIIVNAPLRMKQANKKHPDKWLSAQLYRIFGMGYILSP